MTEFEMARRDIPMTVDDLFFQYRINGGERSHRTVVRWLAGERKPDYTDYDILTFVLNKAARTAGKEPRLRELVAPGDSGSSVVGRRGLEPRTYWFGAAA